MIRKLIRWYRNEPNSKLTTLYEQKHQTCAFLRNWGNTAFCAPGRYRFYINEDIHVCGTCIFTNGIEGERNLVKLIKDLEQINEQTRQTTEDPTS